MKISDDAKVVNDNTESDKMINVEARWWLDIGGFCLTEHAN